MAIRVSRQATEALILETPEVRASRQAVEALYFEYGIVRVSRVSVEVLVPDSQIYERSASSTITFTGGAERDPLDMERSASSSLSLTPSVGLTTSLNLYASSTLELEGVLNYIGPKSLSAFSTLLMSVSADFPFTHEVSASSTITFTDSVVNSGLITVSATSALSLIHFADDETKARDLVQTLTLTGAASVDKILRGFSQIDFVDVARSAKALSANSALTLTQSTRLSPANQYGTSQIEFSQTTRTNPQILVALSTLELTDSNIITKPIHISVTSEFTSEEEVWVDTEFVTTQTGLRQEASVNGFIALSASSVIPLVAMANASVALATGTSLSASSTITWTQKAIPEAIEESATSTLVMTQLAWGAAGKPGSSTLTLTGIASVEIERELAGISTLELEQAVTYTLIIGTSKCQYSPFVGTSTDASLPSPPPAEIDGPMAGIQVPFQLVYPSMGAVTDSVALKTPNLGNKDRLSFNRVLRETRGGTLIVYADPIWPKVQTLVLTFSGLLRVEAHELLAFVDAYLGQEVGLIDWEHRYWRGVITTPDDPVIEDKFDSFTANFSFEGELDPAWNPQVVPPGLRYSAIRSDQEDGYYVPIEPQIPVAPVVLDYYEAEADSAIVIGNPLFIVSGTGHVLPAQANSSTTAQVAGLSITDTSSGATCRFLSEGSIERSDWSNITGAVNLSAGVFYYLDPSTAGRITSTAPTTPGQYVVRIGRAIDTTTLDIEIELPILL